MSKVSYQDIESRLRTAESQLDFILTSSRVEVSKPSGVLKPDGSPEIVRFVGNMKDIWRLSQQFPQDVEPAPAPVEQPVVESEVLGG